MIVSLYSPLPPARTGVADYSAALAGALRASVEVETNPASPRGVPLYHIGNNGLHAAIYRRALDRPGAVVLHDAVLHHFFLGSLAESGYVEEFVYNYGEWRRGFARQLWRDRARSAQDERYFAFPLLRRIAECSRAVIVHNPAAAAMVRSHAPAVPVFEIPHLWEPPPEISRAEAGRLRFRLGVPENAGLFAVFGHLRESKRLISILRAFDRIRRAFPARLLIAGEFISRDLERAVRSLSPPGVIRVPYLRDRDFWLHASAVDACLNLRYPAAGESSGIAIRLMGLGKAILLSDGPENAPFPAGTCLRVDTGPAEQEMLEALMACLCSTRGAAQAIGSRAAGYIRARHAAPVIAPLYLEALKAAG